MCITPVQLKKDTIKQSIRDTYKMQQVPCGKCLDCKKQRVNSWYVRLLAEKKQSISAHFVTLTYDDETLPHTETWLPTLDYKDWQRCIKRVRKNNQTAKPIKYFLVGEYGSTYGRPHYHAIIFNLENPDNLAKEWKYGFTHVGDVTDASIYYTLKYCLKNLGITSEPTDQLPEKALISKGLGKSYLTPAMTKYHKDDVSRSMTMPGNKKIALPRYYRDQLFTEAEKKHRVTLLQEIITENYDKTTTKLYPQQVKKAYADEQLKLSKTD